MRILLYQPYNQIVVYIESVFEQFAKQGHEVYFISHAERGDTHINMEKFGCKTFSLNVPRKNFIQYYWTHVFKLASFCRHNNIDIVYSHFQEANIIAVIAQYFCNSAFVITRHHSDCGYVDSNWKERMADQVINKLAKYYVAVSGKVFRHIVDIEKGNPSKLRIINIGYLFDGLQQINTEEVKHIKENYSAKILLVNAARFIPEKRHFVLFKTIKQLVDSGLDIKLLVMGRGPLEDEIVTWINSNSMANHIIYLGFKINVMDYLASADLVVHLSISEASNSVIKEAGLVNTPVVVCTGVGDFDDYIVHKVNGFLLDKVNPESQLIDLIREIDNAKYDLASMGKRLHQDVVHRFDFKNVAHHYNELHDSILKG